MSDSEQNLRGPAPKSTVVIALDAIDKPKGNPALVVMAGWEIGRQVPIPGKRQVIGRAPGCDVVIPSNSVSREHAQLEVVDEGGKPVVYVSDLGSSNGTQVNGTPVVKAKLAANDKVRMGEVIFRFIDNDGDEHRYHEEVHRRIHMHQLTGLMTRDSFKERLGILLAGSRVGETHCLAMTDLDGLKPVNDTYGHEAGSAVITSMGQMFRQTMRGDDFGGVYGGDECMVCLPHTNLNEGMRVVECLRAGIEQHRFFHGDHLFRLTMSIGIACWPQHGREVDVLLKAADEALYRAKRAGRNQVAIAADTPI